MAVKLPLTPSVKTDIINAGGHWLNKEVMVDTGLVTSRSPGDLPAFNKKIIEVFGEGVRKAAPDYL